MSAQEQLVNVYTKLEQIGEGYQSICYKIQHKQNSSFRVAKIARSQQNDEEFMLSLKQEYKLLKQLDHPNLIKFFENYESENEFIQVMEFWDADSLKKKIIKHKFQGFLISLIQYIQESEIIFIGYQLLQTLEYLHNNQIMHRDINLSNVIYSKKRKILKLLDFGVAKCQLGQTNFNLSSEGNKKFQAPEMFKCQQYSCKIDIWGVGLILYSLLHQKIIGTKSLLKMHCQLDFLYSSQQFQELVSKLLKKNQEKRLSANEALCLEVFGGLH